MDILSVMATKFKVRPVIYTNKKKSFTSVFEEPDLEEMKNKKVDLTNTFIPNKLQSQRNICAFYSRPWCPDKSVYKSLYVDNIFKWPAQNTKNLEKRLSCRRKSIKKKRKICKPREKNLIEPCIYEIFNEDQCVFCFESLYTKGHICDLHKKIPLIKQQSELNEDHVAMTIGEKNRIVVHKKCYDIYADPLSLQWEYFGGKTQLVNNMTMSDILVLDKEIEENDNCGQGEEIVVNKICGKK